MLDGIIPKKHNKSVSGIIGANALISDGAYLVGDDKLMSPRQRREQRRRYHYRQYYARKYAKHAQRVDGIRNVTTPNNDAAQSSSETEAPIVELSPPRVTATVSAFRMSFVGAVVFGMVAMTVIYRSLGQWAWASEETAVVVHTPNAIVELTQAEVAGSAEVSPIVSAAQRLAEQNAIAQAEAQKLAVETEAAKSDDQKNFEKRATEMLDGYPISKMLPEIFKQDRQVAIWLIAMAKQESQWGRRVPVLNGNDCLNYWGFRAKRVKMGTGGHTCFDSIEDAVTTVGKRLHDLHYKYKRQTPERMIVWKCGYSCAGHSDAGVKSWIRTVGMYRNKLL